ncbi:Uncharacterised protein [Staphylococcus aureus]|nr:Uncharacterised protein [Staphylococcus aureus]
MTISAPSNKGDWPNGVINVLSTATSSSCFSAILETALISVILKQGFDGVSI